MNDRNVFLLLLLLLMLIIRKNLLNTTNDIIYIFKPSINNTLPLPLINDYCELLNTIQSEIFPNYRLYGNNNNGILCVSHHLHNNNCNKIYLLYNQFGSRIFKKDIHLKLPLLFNKFNNNKHIIDNITLSFFNNYYKDILILNIMNLVYIIFH